MYGVIDVGSNTIRLCIYDVSNGEIYPMLNNKTTAGLAGYVKKGKMTKKGIQKACDVLNKYKDMMQHFPLEQLFVFATASLRNISNTDEALQTITADTGLSIDVLTGYQEATFDFIGAARSMHLNKGVLLDIGGGSTEILAFWLSFHVFKPCIIIIPKQKRKKGNRGRSQNRTEKSKIFK